MKLFGQKSFRDFLPSPEGDKILYTASNSATLALIKKERVPGANSTPETRSVKEGNIYVYDLKEDRNYLLFDRSDLKANQASPTFLWLASSRHLVFAQNGKINVVEYDGQNLTTIYAGPFLNSFAFPWPDGSSIAIITQFNNATVPYNIYRIGLQ